MSWFRQNKFVGIFLGAFSLAMFMSAWFLLHEKGAADEAQFRFEQTINELTRLRRSTPFPNEENLRKTKAQAENYGTALLALENDLKNRMFAQLPLQPNEFQSQLRLAFTAISERAAANKVQLPVNFYLGFDDYATSLPNSEAAPRLGQQLHAVEWIANTIIEAHVDALNSLTRTPLPQEKAGRSPTSPAASRPAKPLKPAATKEEIVDRTSVNVSFSCSSAAARRVCNEIAAAKDQFYIIRALLVKNQVDKGPKRGTPETTSPAPASPAPGARGKEPAVSFIVGTEHIDVAAKIEILKFNLPEKEPR
jgi:hypothetical protein